MAYQLPHLLLVVVDYLITANRKYYFSRNDKTESLLLLVLSTNTLNTRTSQSEAANFKFKWYY